MNMESYKDIFKFLDNEKLTFDQSFYIIQVCNGLLNDAKTEQQGREIIIRVLDKQEKLHDSVNVMFNDIVEGAGLQPYLDQELLCGSSCIRHEYFKSRYLNDVYLHEEQMQLSNILFSGKSVIVSAPTSFGKSLLIEEVVASKKYKNVVIIQPTLALLDETRKKLKKYKDIYNIVVNTTQKPSIDRGNLFLFTGERVVEYDQFPQVDFFVIDEFYKLSMDRDDERAISLNHALYRLLKMTNRFYMLGPNINSVPIDFVQRYEAQWVNTSFATVAVDTFDISTSEDILEKERTLFELLKQVDSQTLIYCSSPDRVFDLALKYADYYKPENISISKQVEELIQWIKINIHKEWDLIEALTHSIGVHNGALPRHLASSIVDLFNNGSIKFLFCTSTLIEGVNTSAKNVVLFDKKKGPKPIDYFDFKNIVGRSGRMNKHFIGNVFKFDPEPRQENIIVDIPVFTQDKAPIELLIQVERADLNDNSKNVLKPFQSLPEELQQVITSNAGVSVEGQLNIIKILTDFFNVYYPYIAWTGVPNYNQLLKVIELIWHSFLKKGEGGVVSPQQLAFLTNEYYHSKSISTLINKQLNSTYWMNKEPDRRIRLRKVIHSVLQVSKHWFSYKLPRLICVISALQTYVCEQKGRKPGNYSFFASQLENNFLPQNLSILLEYDIPVSAIRKLELLFYFGEETNLDDITGILRTVDLSKYGLLDYELKKILDIL